MYYLRSYRVGNQIITERYAWQIAVDLIYKSKQEREDYINNLSHSKEAVRAWLNSYDSDSAGCKDWFDREYNMKYVLHKSQKVV